MSTGKINKLGFGFLRLPDKETVSAMVDEYMALGGIWFDTCYTYMNEIPQIAQNMEPFVPLGDVEKEALAKVCGIVERNNEIPCTGCRYCTDHCPMGISIPRYFRTYNEVRRYPEEEWKVSYEGIEACTSCGSCVEHCPQNINIPEEIRRMTV